MRAFYSDHFVLPLPADHKFPMAKYSRLRERLLREGTLSPLEVLEAPAAGWDDLSRVHTLEYVQAVADGSLPGEVQRRIGFPWSPQMVERSRRSVGATIAATDAALTEGCGINLAGGTHHAFADRGEGFCVFNDIAVATRLLLDRGAAARVAVVDCDVHQGNGTAAIFREEAAVFTFSMHGANNFPFRKEQSDLDIALEDGTSDEVYLAALECHLPVIFETHQPDFLFYLAGADAFLGDRLGKLKLTMDGMRRRDELVLGRCRAARIPVAIAMGGGYAQDVDDIVSIHAATIAAAARLWRTVEPEAAIRLEPPALQGRP